MNLIYVLIIVILISVIVILINFGRTRRTSPLYAMLGFFSLLLAILIILSANKIGQKYYLYIIVLVIILYAFTVWMFVKSFFMRKKELKNGLAKEVSVVSKQLQQIIEYSKKCRKVYGWRKWRITHKIDSKNMEKKISKLKIPDNVKNELKNEVANGKTVVISEVPFQVDNWVGKKYLVIDQ